MREGREEAEVRVDRLQQATTTVHGMNDWLLAVHRHEVADAENKQELDATDAIGLAVIQQEAIFKTVKEKKLTRRRRRSRRLATEWSFSSFLNPVEFS